MTTQENVTKKQAVTKEQLVQALGKIAETPELQVETQKSLRERIVYAVEMAGKDLRKVMKEDLVDLWKEWKALNASPEPVANSVKPKAKPTLKAKKKAEEVTEEPATESTEEPEEPSEKKPKKQTKKKTPKVTKKEEASTAEVDTVPPVSSKGIDSLPMASVFPKEIQHEELGTLVAVPNKYHTFKSLMEALDEEKTVFMACFWTKRQIRQFQYKDTFAVIPPKEGFPNDLDLSQAVLSCEHVDRFFAMSRYTEALYRVEGEALMPVEDTDPRGGKAMKVRISVGMEFELYVPKDEA